MAQFGPGHYFGEMAMIDRQPRSATVTADEELDTLSLASISVRPLLREHPDIASQDARGSSAPDSGPPMPSSTDPSSIDRGAAGADAAVPGRVRLGRGHGGVPDRGRQPRRWEGPLDLGHLLPPPGRVAGGATGDIAIDHLHHHQADLR